LSVQVSLIASKSKDFDDIRSWMSGPLWITDLAFRTPQLSAGPGLSSIPDISSIIVVKVDEYDIFLVGLKKRPV